MRGGYVLSVSQLNEYVASLLGNDSLLSSLSIRGEISGFKRHSSGHLYFTMKDEGALVRCVMFRQNALSLVCELADGMQVVANGYASIYARDGQYQFYVRSVEEEGEGELYRRFMRLKAKLGAEGLFNETHKKAIPVLPRCVGIVTSPTGAAVQDIMKIIRRRFPPMDMVFCPAKVQGEGAAADIARGIRAIERDGRADVIIIGRGGGSLEELWAFNEETLARTIYGCKVPIISAVGHETDFTISDFTADLRAATPSAAAELCVPEYEALCAQTDENAARLERGVRARLDAERARLDGAEQHGAFTRPAFAVRDAINKLTLMQNAMITALAERLKTQKQALDSAEAALETLSPTQTLARGYAILKKNDKYGKTVCSAENVTPGEELAVMLHDGEIDVSANKVKLTKEER